MFSSRNPAIKEIVLAGGGHAHVLLLRQWAMNPLPGVKLTLISPASFTPYSGMLPGLIAGHYSFEDIHIDLVSLCKRANVEFINAEVSGIDLNHKRVKLQGGGDLAFDILSINTGSCPDQQIPGVREFAIPIKPVAGFWQGWQSILKDLKDKGKDEESFKSISVVGGGAGSVESILAMAWACQNDPDLKSKPKFSLLFQSSELLPAYPARVKKAARKACAKLGVGLFDHFIVREVKRKSLLGAGGKQLPADYVLWCIQAGAPSWPSRSALSCNEAGFIKVNEYLQSESHPFVFAAGDIACMHSTPLPKAGVYAVRQAPFLFGNIRAFTLNTPLKAYKPQGRFLSLLALGDKYATGNWGAITFSGSWVWRWKNRIDRRFMANFQK